MMKPIPKQLANFICYFLRRHIPSVIGFLFIIVIASLGISFSPYILKIIIDAASKEANNPMLFLQMVTYPALLYIAITMIHNLAMRVYHYICLKLFPKLRVEICIALFNSLTEHSVAFFQQNFSGDLANKVQSVSEGVESIIKAINRYVIGNAITLLISFVLLASVHLYFALVLFLGVTIYIFSGYVMSRQTARLAQGFSLANSKITGQLVDSISNIMSIKIFGNTSFEQTRIDSLITDVSSKDQLLQKQIMRTDFFQNLIFTILIILLLGGLIYGRVHYWVSIGDFSFIMALSITIYTMVNGLTNGLPELSKDIGKCNQALNLILSTQDMSDIPDAKTLTVTNSTIKFDGVSFGYNKSKVFDNFNITIPSKQKVGIVGYSGAGKTTLINLLLRLYNVQAGEIYIDKQNILHCTSNSIIKNISLIPQNPELFHRSIMDNIRYGNVEASDDVIYEAAKLAKCHDFITQIPNGYNSIVGEKGISLSGGQRQRIAIARAIIKNAPIIIMDEATSSLDSATEHEIQDTLKVVMQDKTVIVIAHRLATIMTMDRIIFLDSGKIVEDGTVAELQQRNGYFGKMLAIQSMANI